MKYLLLPTYQHGEQDGCCLVPLTPERALRIQRMKAHYDVFKEQAPGLSGLSFGDDEMHWLSINAWRLLDAEEIDATEFYKRGWAAIDLPDAVAQDEQVHTEFRTELEVCTIDTYTFSWSCCMKHGGEIVTHPVPWDALGYLLDRAHEPANR